jgi:hypothetical protein
MILLQGQFSVGSSAEAGIADETNVLKRLVHSVPAGTRRLRLWVGLDLGIVSYSDGVSEQAYIYIGCGVHLGF